MSRRSRKRKGAEGKRWLGKVLIGLVVLVFVLLATGYGMIRSYLHSEGFRKFLSAEAGEMAGVTGEFAPFRWDGLAVDADAFEATGEGPITKIRAEGLHTEVGLGGISRGVWEVKPSGARRVEISVDATRKNIDPEIKAEVNAENQAKKSSKKPSWFPKEAELEGIDIGHVTLNAKLEQGDALANGMRVQAEQAGAKDAFKGTVSGGTIRLPFDFVPELSLDEANLRYRDKTAFLSKATLGAWENGRIEAAGQWDFRTKQYSLEGDLTGVKCQNLLNVDWAKRLTGDVTSSFTLSNISGSPVASGKAEVRNGVLTALPVLDALAAYADTRRFRVLTLSEARAEWGWRKGEISISKLVLSSEGLVRLEGDVVLRGEKIDGIFRLGLAPGTLATIPGAETDVFLPGERGLLWAPLRITGTLDDPKEDLTDRLVAAAGLRMFEQLPETGEKVIKFSRTVLGENPSATLEKGVKAVDKGVKAVEKHADTVIGIGNVLLDGILGAEKKEEDSKKDEEKPQ